MLGIGTMAKKRREELGFLWGPALASDQLAAGPFLSHRHVPEPLCACGGLRATADCCRLQLAPVPEASLSLSHF